MGGKSVALGSSSPLMTVPEVAAYLRLNPATIYRLAKEGSLPAFRIGRQWRFSREALDDWLRTRAQPLERKSTP